MLHEFIAERDRVERVRTFTDHRALPSQSILCLPVRTTHSAVTDHDDFRSGETARSCKIGRIARRHGLAELDGDLASRWTGASGERDSTRDIAGT